MHAPLQPRNLPPLSEWFVGRRATHRALRDALRATPVLTLCGPAGIGKSQLAIDYALRCYAKDAVVWWLRAGDPVTLALDFARLAIHLQLASLDDLPSATQATRTWLAAHEGWLLVFDEADDLSLLSGYLPLAEGGQVLCLSRGEVAASGTARFWVGPLLRAESIALLRARCRCSVKDAVLDDIAEQLGDHPLAMGLVGTLIAQKSNPPGEFLAKLRAERTNAQHAPMALAFSACLRVFDPLCEIQPLMRPLMHLYSLCGPFGLPYAMFSWESLSRVRDAGDASNSARRRSGPDPLAVVTDLMSDAHGMAYSFLGLWLCGLVGLDRKDVKDGTDILEIPRLLQEMWLEHHRKSNLWPYGHAAVRTLNHAFSMVQKDGSGIWMQILPHLLVALRRAATLRGSTAAIGLTLHRLGEWLLGMHAHGPAQALLSASMPLLVDDDPMADPRGPQLAQSRVLIRLSECQRAQQDLAGATASARRALALVSNGSHDGVDVANAENVLGVALGTQEDYAAAEPHLLRAEALLRQKHGQDPAYAACLLSLGQTQGHLGKPAEAEKTLRRALQVLKDGNLHSECRSLAHHYLGQALYTSGSKDEARRNFEASLELDQRLVPSNHPRVGTNLLYLVALASERGDTAAARTMAERAFPILIATQQMDPGILSLYRAVHQTLNQGGSASC